jgi:hypothetical protein
VIYCLMIALSDTYICRYTRYMAMQVNVHTCNVYIDNIVDINHTM